MPAPATGGEEFAARNGHGVFLCALNRGGADWQRNFTLRIDVSVRTEDLALRMKAGAIYGKDGVQDAAGPMREEQKTQVEKVLAELAVSTKPIIQVLNKVDLVPHQELANLSSDREAIPVSSLQHTGLKQLLFAIDAALVVDPLVESSFRLPQSEGSILASLEGGAIIDEKRFEGNLVFLRARGPASLLNRYRSFRDKHDLSNQRLRAKQT
jgi:GTP-binding protein HflX